MSSRDDRPASGTEPTTSRDLSRRDALKLAAAAVTLPIARLQARAPKRVIIAGGGIGGLCCGYELMKRGHDVVVLEASERTGGHVFTVREGLDDGLYADGGAEQFTQPGYERYWGYVREFNLSYEYYPRREQITRWIDGKMYTQEMLADPKVLAAFGLNQRELKFLKDHPFPELAGLYYKPYYSAFQDEYRPFGAGLDALDAMSTTELFRRDGASPGALKHIGGSGSALQSVWHAAILNMRGVALFPLKVFRLTGGNQTLPDTFAKHLGDRVKLKSPVTKIEHSDTGVKVTAGAGGAGTTYEGDYLVCAMSAFMLRNIPVEPAFPAGKVFALQNVPYYHDTRVIFQTKSRFWEKDNLTSTMEFNVPALNHVWRTGEDVKTTRGLLVGTSTGPQSGDGAAAAYRKLYPGKSEDIEKTNAVVWSANPWASACETTAYPVGTLKKFWPALIEPQGRVHFVGAYADNLNWGQEAATRSANRVMDAIDKA